MKVGKLELTLFWSKETPSRGSLQIVLRVLRTLTKQFLSLLHYQVFCQNVLVLVKHLPVDFGVVRVIANRAINLTYILNCIDLRLEVKERVIQTALWSIMSISGISWNFLDTGLCKGLTVLDNRISFIFFGALIVKGSLILCQYCVGCVLIGLLGSPPLLEMMLLGAVHGWVESLRISCNVPFEIPQILLNLNRILLGLQRPHLIPFPLPIDFSPHSNPCIHCRQRRPLPRRLLGQQVLRAITSLAITKCQAGTSLLQPGSNCQFAHLWQLARSFNPEAHTQRGNGISAMCSALGAAGGGS